MHWRRLFGRSRVDRDRADEFRAHLDLATEHYIAQGVPPAEAARRARLGFGNIHIKREDLHDMNRWRIVDVFARDVRHAIRVLRRTPAFTAAAVLTLAVVIGANAAVFGLADSILLKPLPYPKPDELAAVESNRVGPGMRDAESSVDGRMWETVRDNLKSADSALYGSDLGGGVNLVVGNAASFVQQQRVSAGYFHVLGVAPRIGREFTPNEDRPGGPAIAVLSDGLWRNAFHGDPTILGSRILLRGAPYEVVGVMPAGFRGPEDTDVWTPLRPNHTGEGGGSNYGLFIRRHSGATWTEVNNELRAMSTPDIFQSMGRIPDGVQMWLSAEPMQDVLVEDEREPLVILAAAVGVVLLIACVNLAALLLAQGGGRTKEIATRMALGGSRGAIVRQLMTESAVLACAGGVLGVLLGWLSLDVLKTMGGTTFADWTHATFDGRVLAMTAGLSLLTSVFFGLVPALHVSRVDVRGAMASDGSRTVAGGSRHWLGRGLVVTEVALGVVLLVSAGLLIRTVLKLESLDAGYDGRGVTTASVSLEDARYTDPAVINHLFDATLERIRQSPGVESAAVSLGLPYTRLLNLGMRFSDASQGRLINLSYVTSDFARVLHIPVRRGRDLAEADRSNTLPVVLVNEAFVRLYSNDRDVIGRRIVLSNAEREIVGVLGDVQQTGGFFVAGMTRGPLVTMPMVYLPASQANAGIFSTHIWFRPSWIVRAASAAAATTAILRAVGAVDPLLPVADVESMASVQAAAIHEQRLLMTLVGVLAAAALLLAAIGIYGLVSHLVAERTRELGIRMALGATAGQSVRTVAGSGITLAAIGAVAGGLLSVLAARLVASFLWGVAVHDARTYLVTAAFLFVVAVVASVVPALRILRIDPAKILRS